MYLHQYLKLHRVTQLPGAAQQGIYGSCLRLRKPATIGCSVFFVREREARERRATAAVFGGQAWKHVGSDTW